MGEERLSTKSFNLSEGIQQRVHMENLYNLVITALK